MSYTVKIDVRVTDDGIKSWLQWEGVALRAYAEKMSEDRQFKTTRMQIVPPRDALICFLHEKDRKTTTPENYARWKVETRVREDWEKYVARRERGFDGCATNGGW